MSETLPPLPKTDHKLKVRSAAGQEWEYPVYSEADIQAYATAATEPLLQRIAELERQIEEARNDAERYRCLKQKRPVLLLTGFFGNGCVNCTLDEVDAAIDAAMQKGQS